MYLTGFADEASQDLAVQIETTKRLGWNAIEARFSPSIARQYPKS